VHREPHSCPRMRDEQEGLAAARKRRRPRAIESWGRVGCSDTHARNRSTPRRSNPYAAVPASDASRSPASRAWLIASFRVLQKPRTCPHSLPLAMFGGLRGASAISNRQRQIPISACCRCGGAKGSFRGCPVGASLRHCRAELVNTAAPGSLPPLCWFARPYVPTFRASSTATVGRYGPAS
jgi:hypothetical protein